MDPYAPINGVSIDRYAQLSAEVSDTQDPEKQAEIAAHNGVNRPDWEAAKAGWTARIQDPSLLGAVATRFMPLYQAALARKNPTPQQAYNPYAPQPQVHPPYAHHPYAQQPYARQQQQQAYNHRGAQDFGAQVGSAFASLGSALGSLVDQAVVGYSIGARVMVTWSDGNRYPGNVVRVHGNQVEVAFPDGRHVWVPMAFVNNVY